MAVTVHKNRIGADGNHWWINATTADASSGEELYAAPDSGKAIVLRRVLINVHGAETVTIGGGEVDSGVMHPVVGPIDAPIDDLLDIPLPDVRLPEKEALVLDGGTGSVVVTVCAELLEVDV